jgi:ubiquinone/menaquinone biosynthesis C-methylase UbiE
MFTARDREKCNRLYEKYYDGRKFADTLYRESLHRHLRPGQRVMDAGCGRYLAVGKELSSKAEVVGIDLEPQLETDNGAPPFGVRADVSRLPFPAATFDMVISRSVIEHVADPPEVFREICRVLRPGGTVVIVTPNKFDYVSVVAALTPYKLHRWLVSRIFPVSEDDVFPTLYRANTASAIRRALSAAGFVEKDLYMINHYPAYLMFSPLLFRLGVLYERITSLPPFAFLRGSILCVFEKPGKALASAGVPDDSLRSGVEAGVP